MMRRSKKSLRNIYKSVSRNSSSSSSSAEPVCRSCRSQRSRYLTCTLPSNQQNLAMDKQRLGDFKESVSIEERKNEIYHEKYLSKKILNFHWEESNTTLPGKSDLLETICFRIENNVCPDITVRIKDRKFMCHSIVLQCYMDLPETRKDIVLNEKKISYETYEEIYQWMLSAPEKSHLKLSRENIVQLLGAAKYLGVRELEHQCWAFISSEEMFNEATAFFLYLNARINLTQACLREPIMQLMLPRIQSFFLILVSSKNWIELDVQDVCALLSSNHIRVRCELEIFLSAVRWLLAEWSVRKLHVLQVMQCVRFCLMSPFHLLEICQSPEFIGITSHPGVQKLITEGMDVATVKSSLHLVSNNRKELSQMLGVTEQSLRHYLKYHTELYESQGFIYRDFMKQLTKIKDGEISLNEESLKEDVKMRPKSKGHCTSQKKRQKSYHSEMKGITEGNLIESKNITNEVEKVKSSVIVRPNEENFTDVNWTNTKKLNENDKQAVSGNCFALIPSSVEHKAPPLSEQEASNLPEHIDAESSAYMEDSEAVLVFGGVDAHAPYAKYKKNGRDIHRYNPFVNTWQQIGQMPVARHHHATVYLNGMVYMAGGVDPSRDDGTDMVSNTVWVFNPSNTQWSCTSPMLHPRKIFSLVTCLGKIYAIGGQDTSTLLSSVECYDPASQTWREVAPLQSARKGTAAAEVNGKIWVAGGYTGDTMNPVTDQVECYDPRTNTWTCLDSKLRYPRYLATLVNVNNEKLYIIGGASQTDGKMDSVSDVDMLNIKETTWKYISELILPRHSHSACILSSQILIIGGVTTVHKRTLKSVECWCFDRQAWIKGVSGLPASVIGHSCVALPLKSSS